MNKSLFAKPICAQRLARVPQKGLSPLCVKQFITFLIALAAMTVSTTSAWAQTESIKYLDYDHYPYNNTFSEASYDGPTKITSSSTDVSISGWNYVEGNVTINGKVTLTDHTYLILCDDATLTIDNTSGDGIDLDSRDLTIYAQSSGDHKGKLIIKSYDVGMGIGGDVTINGGDISVPISNDGIICNHFILNGGTVTVASLSSGIDAVGYGVTINGGKVSATGTCDGIYGHYVTINGGQVYAEGDDTYYAGIRSNSPIYLGWTNASDFIKANSYSATSIDALKNFYINGTTPLNAGSGISASSINDLTLTPNAASHTITLGTSTGGGTIEVDKTKAFENERVAITATPETGKMLTSLSYTYGSTTVNILTSKEANDYVFTMPDANVTSINATFATIVAKIGTTEYASFASALAAVADGETITIISDKDESSTNYNFSTHGSTRNVTINVNGCTYSFGNISNKYGYLNIIGPGTFNFGSFSNQGEFLFKDVTVNCNFIDNPGGSANITFDNAKAVCNSGIVGNSSLQLYGADQGIVLKNGSDVEIRQGMYVGYNDNFTLDIQDAASILKLRSCAISSMNKSYVEDQFLQYIRPDQKTAFSSDLANGNAITLDLRASWGIMLENGLSNATVTFYDGGTSFDPTAFTPSTYTTSTTFIDNSDNKDHYVIAHIVPAAGYWTDLSLLSVIETGASLTGAANTITMLERDQYDPVDPSQGLRYDGSGWYYYKLDASHSVANGYTNSTLAGQAPHWFDLNDTDDSDGDKVVQDGTKITVPNHEGWTAEILLDAVTFAFDGAVKTPAVTQITVDNGAGTTFTMTADLDKQLKVNGTKHIGHYPAMGDYLMIGQPGGWFNRTTPDGLGFDVTVPLPVADETAERGTATNPWLVSSIAQMTLFGQCVDDGAYDFDGKYVRLVADLAYDATATNNYMPIGSGTSFAGTFFGTTDTGTPHTISGIHYDGGGNLDKVGLFSQLGKNNGTGAVKDLQLKNCKFYGSDAYLSGFVGGVLAGSVMGTLVSNVTVLQCEIVGAQNVSGDTSLGGIAGNISKKTKVSGCTVSNSVVDNKVLDDLDSESMHSMAGGIAGYVHGSEVSDCTVESCIIYTDHSGENCPGNEVGGIAGYAGYGVTMLDNVAKGSMQIYDVIQSNNNSRIGAIYGNRGDGNDLSSPLFMRNYYDYGVYIMYKNGAMSAPAEIYGYMPRGTRVFKFDENPPYDLISAEFADETYGTVGYNNGDPNDPITGTNDAAKMLVRPATISLTAAGTGRSLEFVKKTTPDLATASNPADCYAIEGSTYYYAPGDEIKLTAKYQQRTEDVRTFYDEVTITVVDGSAAQAEVTVSPTGDATLSGDTYTREFSFNMPADGATVSAGITESKWFTINTVNYNAADPSQPFAYNWMTYYHEWTDGTGTASSPANYHVANYDNPLLDVEVMTVSSVNSADGSFALADIDGGICYSGVPTIFHYAVANDANAVLPQKLKFTPVDPTTSYTKPTVAPQFLGVIDAAGKTLTATDKCYVLNNSGDFILAYPTEGDDKIAAHKCYIDWNIGYNGNTPAPARLISSGDATGIDSMVNGQWSMDNLDGDWFSLDGRRLNGQPTRKGIYIHHGKKTVIK